jgi:hypothetical protein
MNRYSSYIHYWFVAKKRHNIHSPFVYDLSDKCLQIGLKNKHKELIAKQKAKLSSQKEVITIADFGAGSKWMGNERRICDIFKNSRSSNDYANLLYRLANHYQPKRILELGTSLAWGTLHMHLGNENARIDTVEGCPQTYEKAKSLFPVDADNVHFYNARFEDFFDELSDIRYDMIFIDGNHRGQALLDYIDRLFPHAHSDTLWILDDIRWSDDMWSAWERITQDSRFHVTVDLMRVGLALMRETQVKETFSLRL